MIPLADRVVNLTPRADTSPREPEPLHLEPGEIVFTQGDRGDLVYVVEDGRIEIVRTRDDGTEEHITNVEAGSYFGELAPMFGLQRSATARAVGATNVTGYGMRDFREKYHLPSEAKILTEAAD